MYIKRNSIFLIDREPNSQDGKLRYRIKWNNNTVAFNVGFRVEFDKWSKETQRCKNNTTHGKQKIPAAIINKEINRFEDIAQQIFTAFENADKTPEADEFREEFNKKIGKVNTSNKTFLSIYDEFTYDTGIKNQWTDASFKKYTTLKNHLTSCFPNITFHQLNEEGLNNFVHYLRNIKEYRNSSIAKLLSFLKSFLQWATKKGYNINKDYISFSPKLKTSERKVIFLDWEELMTLYNYQVPETKKHLEHIRDVFCFCCFSSLRYSDVANLKRSDVFQEYISITTIKTSDSITIELNDYSKEILHRYSEQTFFNNLALPIISNQKMNVYLKELCQLCGLNKPVTITYYKGNQRIDQTFPKYELITTHCGRRTFICNALMLGIAPQIVMKWTGHSNYSAMRPYIDVADNTKKQAMNLFNKKSLHEK